MAALAGWAPGIPRFLAHASAFVVCGFGVAAAQADPEEEMLAGAWLVTASGARRFGRFLRLPVESVESSRVADARPEPVLPEIDAFLHELTRLRLPALLSVLKRADFVYLLRHGGLCRGNLSVRMTKLAEAGLVDIDKGYVGKRPRTVHTLTSRGASALAAYKAGMATLLEALPD